MGKNSLPQIKIKPPERFVIERDVKKEVKRIVGIYREYLYHAHGLRIFDFMPVSNGMGKHGVPDFNFCLFGQWVAVETKYGNNEPTARQKACLKEIRESRGIALVINEANITLFVTTVETLYERYLQGELKPLPISGLSNTL